jgi:hypothetical protein
MKNTNDEFNNIKVTLNTVFEVVKAYDIINEASGLGPTLCAFAFRRDLKDLIAAVNGELFDAVNADLIDAVNKGWLDVEQKELANTRIHFLLSTLIQEYKGKIPPDLETAVFQIVRAR